ncbi:hypothetical protein TNCV_4241161 [Trichonephila clavipes]|nr:hypothetical protein TNCV_4241161 [Trichonephila clavipes]
MFDFCGRRLGLDARKENPTSREDKVTNAKKKTSGITSQLISEEIQKARLAVIGILQIEQLSELKEKIKWHFSSLSAPWCGGRGWLALSSRFYKSALQELRNGFVHFCPGLPCLRRDAHTVCEGENSPKPSKDSGRLKSPEVPVPSTPAPNPVSEVSRPVKLTRYGRRMFPRQRLNL